jgi:hypothetical protein
LARLALIVQEGDLTFREVCLGRILDFFGVPWKRVSVSELVETVGNSEDCVAFGPIRAVTAALEGMQQANRAASRLPSFYAYADEDRGASERGIRFICGCSELSLHRARVDKLSVFISKEFADVAGPLAGLKVSCRLGKEDHVLAGTMSNGTSSLATIISAGGLPVFVRCQHSHGTIFFNTCSQMVDIDQPAPRGFYDVKEHFCSAVPLVMFVRFMFPDVVWRPQEHGACLIIDDPLLNSRYGFCDFTNLRDLMQRHRFTTNIAFIPWNWRRTSAAAADFFRRQPELFSLSVHGCDHIAAEFGVGSLEALGQRARLAQSRMRNHEGRTGLEYDPVMVFPQGVFSSKSPEILKHNGFLAAVNTETLPVDRENAQTRIRDVWDLAIMSYSGFPIFTRRYAFHGLENFAFDLLLGKPCLIVAHHDFFKDGGIELIDLIEKLCSFNASLHWRTLGEVVRRSCRRRTTHLGAEEVEMYGTELCVDNSSDQAIDVTIRKRESQIDLVSEILSDGKPAVWTSDVEHLVFSDRILPRSKKRFRVNYRKQADGAAAVIGRSLQYEIAVAVRRALSEFRDDYLSRYPLLSATAGRFKGALTRNN